MPYLKKHGAFFIHIPKTGGSTVLKMFGLDVAADQDKKGSDIFFHNDDNFEWIHASAKMLKIMAPDVYKKTFKFSLCRNPYDKLVSEYFWRRQVMKSQIIDFDNLTFEQFIFYLDEHMPEVMMEAHRHKNHFMTQKSFVDERVSIFRYENIDECFDFLIRKFGVCRLDSLLNKTEHEYYMNYYSRKMKEIVYKLYIADFHYFNYAK